MSRMKPPSLVSSFCESLELNKKDFFAFLLLYFSSANWYAVTTQVLPHALSVYLKGAPVLWASFGFDFLIALSMFVAGLLIEGRSRLAFLRFSAISAIFLTLMLPLASTVESVVLLMSFLGVPAGFTSLALAILFAEKTFARERGRIAGAMVALAIFTSPAVIILSRSFSLVWALGVLIALNFIVVILSFVIRDLEVQRQIGRQRALGGFGKNYFLYFIAWALVSSTNGFFSSVFDVYVESFREMVQLGFVLQYVTACVMAWIGGFLMDWYGRKPLILLGLAFFGVSMSLLALASNPIAYSLIWATNGGSWGLFLPTFYLFIWGEAATGQVRALAYSLGLMVFHLARSLGFLAFPYLSQHEPIGLALVSSSVVFLGSVPLVLAHETLPSDERQALRFSRYLSRVREEVERQ